MSLHSWFGRHQPDLKGSRWQEGHFVTECLICRAAMEKRPGESWALAKP